MPFPIDFDNSNPFVHVDVIDKKVFLHKDKDKVITGRDYDLYLFEFSQNFINYFQVIHTNLEFHLIYLWVMIYYLNLSLDVRRAMLVGWAGCVSFCLKIEVNKQFLIRCLFELYQVAHNVHKFLCIYDELWLFVILCATTDPKVIFELRYIIFRSVYSQSTEEIQVIFQT